MKKKIVALCLVVCLATVGVCTATFAYLMDKESAVNTFTVGNVNIELQEKFDEEEAKLMPGIDITKEIDVQNTGSEDAYVRVHIAIPSMLDSGSEDQPQYAAYNNTLHWNFSKASYAEGLWNWNADVDGANYPGNGGNWNCYQQEINGILYNVYVATYETALKTNEIADNAIYKVYLDKKVTNEQLEGITAVLGSNPKIYVVAEGGQVEGFDNAYDALNTQFGVPGNYNPFAA